MAMCRIRSSVASKGYYGNVMAVHWPNLGLSNYLLLRLLLKRDSINHRLISCHRAVVKEVVKAVCPVLFFIRS
jgi:hypothetical protein